MSGAKRTSLNLRSTWTLCTVINLQLFLHRFRVPAVYLTWAGLMFLAFLPFNGINNLRAFNVAFSSIPTAPTKSPVYSPERSFTERSEDIVYTLGPKGFAKGCRVLSSRSM